MSSTIQCKNIDFKPKWKKYNFDKLGNDIHVWRLNILDFFQVNPALNHLLDNEDEFKMNRLVKEEDRKRFYISKIMRKKIISTYLGVPPNSVKFGLSEFHKPFLVNFDHFHFNITHSGSWVMFVFSNVECGIDVEYNSPDFKFENLLSSIFTPREAEIIKQADFPFKEFYRLWTAKESLLKGLGIGLTEALTEICCLEGCWKLPVQLFPGEYSWTNLSFNMEAQYCWSISFKDENRDVYFYEY